MALYRICYSSGSKSASGSESEGIKEDLMNQSEMDTNKYDTYLLYEYMKKVSFTVRILVKLKENVDPGLLKEAAREAISRFPYFAVKVRVDEKGSFVLDHNEAPIPVLPEENKRLMLGSDQTGGHLFAIPTEITVYGLTFLIRPAELLADCSG